MCFACFTAKVLRYFSFCTSTYTCTISVARCRVHTIYKQSAIARSARPGSSQYRRVSGYLPRTCRAASTGADTPELTQIECHTACVQRDRREVIFKPARAKYWPINWAGAARNAGQWYTRYVYAYMHFIVIHAWRMCNPCIYATLHMHIANGILNICTQRPLKCSCESTFPFYIIRVHVFLFSMRNVFSTDPFEKQTSFKIYPNIMNIYTATARVICSNAC